VIFGLQTANACWLKFNFPLTANNTQPQRALFWCVIFGELMYIIKSTMAVV
jgi:hypothetical protein